MKIGQIKKIKRLIKKAEFADGIESGLADSGMLSIYKNPTSKEIEEARSEAYGHTIRGTIFNDGTIYCWNGILLHDEAPKQFTPNESFRFAYEYNEWILDLHRYFTFEQGINKLLELRQTLQQFGDFGQEDYLTFFYSSDEGLEYKKFDEENQIADTISKNCIGFLNIDLAKEFVDRISNYKNDNQ